MARTKSSYVDRDAAIKTVAGKTPRTGVGRTKQTAAKSTGGRPPSKKQLLRRSRLPKKIIPNINRGKKKRHRPGVVALREIRKYQKSTELLIRKLPFSRVLREIGQNLAMEKEKPPYLWQRSAVEALQYAAESYLT